MRPSVARHSAIRDRRAKAFARRTRPSATATPASRYAQRNQSGKEPDVVELALGIEQDSEQRDERPARQAASLLAVAAATPINHADNSKNERPPVRLRQQDVDEGAHVRVTHARRERLLEDERYPPPRGQQRPAPTDDTIHHARRFEGGPSKNDERRHRRARTVSRRGGRRRRSRAGPPPPI